MVYYDEVQKSEISGERLQLTDEDQACKYICGLCPRPF